jgi:hypothetical protein
MANGRGKPYTIKFIKEEAVEFLKWMKLEESIFFKTFAIERGYHPQRMSEFGKRDQDFAEVLDFAHAWQEQKVVTMALRRKLDSPMSKFVLANCHDWKEREKEVAPENQLEILLKEINGRSKDLVQPVERPLVEDQQSLLDSR